MGDDAPRPEVPRRQRRRDGAGHVQGPPAAGRRPAPAHRRHDHQRLRHRGRRRLHLPALGVRKAARRRWRRPSPRRTPPATSARTSSARASAWSCTCTSAPAATCAARRRRCSTPSKAGAPSRAPSRRIRQSAGCGASRRSSTTSRRSATCRTSSCAAPEWFKGLSRGDGRRHEALRRQRPGEEARAVGTADGHDDPRDPRRARRRHAGRATGSAACCPAAPRPISSPRSTSTCRWISTRVEKAGSRLGTGTMIVLDDQTCPVGMVLNLEQFFARESCGWCTPCREGLPWVARTARRRIEEGEGEPGDLEILESTRGCWRPGHTFCALAPGAVEPLQSALKYFRERFRAAYRREALPLEVNDAMADDLHRQQAVRGQGRAEPARRLPVARVRPAVLLLAPGAALRRRLPAVRGQAVQGRERHARARSSWPA